MKDQERSEISRHELLIYKAFVDNKDKWLTNQGIAEMLTGSVAIRTVRLHTLRLVKLGILDLAEVFPAHRFKASIKAHRRNLNYVTRLKKALEVFGM